MVTDGWSEDGCALLTGVHVAACILTLVQHVCQLLDNAGTYALPWASGVLFCQPLRHGHMHGLRTTTESLGGHGCMLSGETH